MVRLINWFLSYDVQLFNFMNHRLQCKVLDWTMPRFTHLGGAVFTICILLAVMLAFSSPVSSWAFEALLALAISHIIVHIMKKLFPRSRPYTVHPNTRFFIYRLKDFSFPSGHATAAFSISVVFSYYSLFSAVVLLPLAALIAFSRMYLGVHYPTDCITGGAIGTLTALAVVSSDFHTLWLIYD